MCEVSVDTDALQQAAEALGAYAEEMLVHFDQVAQLWRDLPDHWQGDAAETARADVRTWVNRVEESSNMAKFLAQRLTAARRALEEGDPGDLERV